MTLELPLSPEGRVPRAPAPTLCRWPALAVLVGGCVLVPGEALGLSVGIATFILVRTALDDLLDQLELQVDALTAASRRTVAGSPELGAGDGEGPVGIAGIGGPTT